MHHFQKALMLVLVMVLTIGCSLPSQLSGNSSQKEYSQTGDIIVGQVWLMQADNRISQQDGLYYHPNSFSLPLEVKMRFTQMTSQNSSGYYPRSNPNQVDYQLCYAIGATCDPEGDWKSSNGIGIIPITAINLDWNGQKKVVVRIRFRDVSQKTLLTLGNENVHYRMEDALYHIDFGPRLILEYDFPVEINKPVTPTGMPPLAITLTYAATVSPVQGSIELAPGTSVIGGTAGSIQQVQVVFRASSTLGKVTEMRVDGGNWEAFVTLKEYPLKIMLNWYTVNHCVEYRDEKGNISPRYCDNKAVEGSPKLSP